MCPFPVNSFHSFNKKKSTKREVTETNIIFFTNLISKAFLPLIQRKFFKLLMMV